MEATQLKEPETEHALNTQTYRESGNNRCLYSDVLFIVAVVTLGQGLCFLAVSMFLGDVTVLPEDPLTLIGGMYLAMGIAFILLSKLFERTGKPSGNLPKSKYFFGQRDCSCNFQKSPERNRSEEKCKKGDQDSNNEDNYEQGTSCSSENTECCEKPEDEKEVVDRKLKESRDQWDVIETTGEVLVDDVSSNKKIVTIGCDSAMILTSTPGNSAN